MILHIIAALVAALLALTGVSAEDETLSWGEVVTEECDSEDPIHSEECANDVQNGTPPPSELPGPFRGAGS